jgi:hypothetical protein
MVHVFHSSEFRLRRTAAGRSTAQQAARASGRGPFPPWSWDELLLALWTASHHVGAAIPPRHPEITGLSFLLRSAHGEDAVAAPRMRNPHGVARKVWRYLALLEGRSFERGSELERQVWAEFITDPQRLPELARDALNRLVALPLTPSRGPPPTIGKTTCYRRDVGAFLYLAVLDGLPSDCDAIILKVGRSNQPRRREDQLNFGLPLALGLRWRMAKWWYLPDSMVAHQAEQAILSREAAAGTCIGGEFVRIAKRDFGEFVSRCEAVVGIQQVPERKRRRRRSSHSARN